MLWVTDREKADVSFFAVVKKLGEVKPEATRQQAAKDSVLSEARFLLGGSSSSPSGPRAVPTAMSWRGRQPGRGATISIRKAGLVGPETEKASYSGSWGG